MFNLEVARVFVGKSPLNAQTKFSGGYGNSILLQLRDLTYMFIGDSIKVFRAKSEIVRFSSPVGNSGVPYPWAEDSAGNYYLLGKNVVMLNRRGLKKDIAGDPYTYYQRVGLMTTNIGRVPPEEPLQRFDGIVEWGVGEEAYTMTA